MSEKMPVVSGKDLLKALAKFGYKQIRTRGSHVQVVKFFPDGSANTFPVPVHGKSAVPKGTLRDILRQAGMTIDELRSLL